MPTIGLGDCLSNYWSIWLINGLGSIFGLALNMAVSFFVLKYFHNMTSSSPSQPKRSKSNVSQIRNASAVSYIRVGSWASGSTMGNAFSTSRI